MAEFPALPLFTDAYLADTRHLNTIQHGAYLLMLMTAWRSGGCCLLDDDNYLARITGLDKRTWVANKAILMSFWHLNDEQKWQQRRLMDERNYVEQLRNKNAAAGRASALKRLNRGSTTVQPKLNETSTPTPIPTQVRKKDTTYLSKEKRGSRIPDDFEPDASCHQLAEKLLLTNQDCQGALENFIDYWKAIPAAKGVKLDWQATFRNQLRHVSKQKGKANGTNQPYHKPGTVADGFAKVRAVIAEAERRENESGGTFGQEDDVSLPRLRQSPA